MSCLLSFIRFVRLFCWESMNPENRKNNMDVKTEVDEIVIVCCYIKCDRPTCRTMNHGDCWLALTVFFCVGLYLTNMNDMIMILLSWLGPHFCHAIWAIDNPYNNHGQCLSNDKRSKGTGVLLPCHHSHICRTCAGPCILIARVPWWTIS